MMPASALTSGSVTGGSGKTVLALYQLIQAAYTNRQHAPRYAYVAPLYRQAKTIAWDLLTHLTRPIPGTVVNQAELRVDLTGNRRIQLYGADNPDSLRGLYLDGVVFDEYAQMRPRVWHEVVRPALADREGWATFIGTPMGHNHFYDLYQEAHGQPDWHTALYTVDDTQVLPEAELESARRTMAPEQYAQEFLCSFESALIGAYYASYLETAQAEQRLTRVPWEPSIPVHVAFDIGVSDSTAAWFIQPVGNMLHVIDYLEASDHGLEWYAKVMKEKPYTYSRFFWPHDMQARDFSSDGRTRLAMAESLGLRPSVLVPQGSVADGIQAVRSLFPRFVFDAEKCHDGLEALKAYRRAWNETRKDWDQHPLHDWCLTGDTKVLTRYGMYQIMDLPKTGEVLTSCGWKVYQHPRITRRNAPLVEVVFSDGLTVRCTPEHLFKTASGWISAAHLQPNSVILSSLTRSRSISMAVSTVCGRVSATLRAAADACTAMCGKPRLALSLLAATSITAMATSSTMPWPISNVLMSTPTSLQHGRNHGASVRPMGILRTKPGLLRQRGMHLQKGGSGIVVLPNAREGGRSGRAKNDPVSFVRSRLHALCARMGISKNTARPPAKPLIIAAVKPLLTTEDVWCLTVPGYEEFSLTNGALVHNSSHGADALRTFASAYREDTPAVVMPQMPAGPPWAREAFWRGRAR